MRIPAVLTAACCAALAGCAHGAKPWRAANGEVTPEDCAIYAAIAPTLGDPRKYLLHPVTVPTVVPEQGFNNPDAMPGFTMEEVAGLEAERRANVEQALRITCDWTSFRLPGDAFAWKSARSYDLAFSQTFRSRDGKLVVVDVSHNDTARRGLRAMRYLLGREADGWLIAGYYTLPTPRVEIGPITRGE